MILIAPQITIVLSISIVILWVPMIWSSTSLFSLYGLLHMGHLKNLSLRVFGSWGAWAWISWAWISWAAWGTIADTESDLVCSILGSWGCGFNDFLASTFLGKRALFFSRHFGQVHSCPLSSISFPFFGLMPTHFPWNHSEQVSQAIINRLLWGFLQMHQSLFGSSSAILFSVEKLSSEFKSITSMSEEFLGCPGNSNGSPEGQI